MLVVPSPEIDSYPYLFLHLIAETPNQGLRLVVEGAQASAECVTLKLGATELSELHPIRGSGRIFEITWESYIAYCVRNESYCGTNTYEEIATGKKLRIYSKSHFLDYVSRATFATGEYPGSFQHYCLFSENHIVDVISVCSPQIRRSEDASS
jgi:hypothetical protein